MSLFRKNITRVGSIGGLEVMFRNASDRSILRDTIRDFENEQHEMRGWLTPETREQLYCSEPMSCAAINKTSSLMVTSWFELDSIKRDKSLDPHVHDLFFEFYDMIQLKSKIKTMIDDAMTHGNGWLEIIPGKSIDDSTMPILPSDGLNDVVNMEPTFMKKEIMMIDPKKNSFYYLYKDKKQGWKKIHNSRVLSLPWYKLGTMRFGFGVYDVAFRSLMAKINMDWSVGEIIYRHGKPFLVINVKEGSPKEVETAMNILKKITPRTHFAGSDRTEFKMIPPAVVDPTAFANFYYINMARACEMPQMEFMGAQSGELTGSQVDKGSWYQSLASRQEIRLSPIISSINNQFLFGKWNGGVYWNPIYVNEKAKAETDLINAQYIKTLMDAGLMIDTEGRQLCRDIGMPFPADDTEFTFDLDTNPIDETKKETPDEDDIDFMQEQINFWKQRQNDKK